MGGKKKTTTKSSSTQVPVISEPYKTYLGGFAGDINEFLQMDPTQFVAPASELQTLAFGDAKNLGGWEPYLQTAQGFAEEAANAPATKVTATGYDSGNVPVPYTTPGAQLGGVTTYGGTTLNDPMQMQAAQLADPIQLKKYMADYQNPYTEQVINATLADFDQYAGQQRAAQAARGANADAFGGSRWGIAEGQLEGELSRGRAKTEADLLDQQYRLAASLAAIDAGAANEYGLVQGQFQQQAGMANQDAFNQFAMQQGLLDQQTGAMNMDAFNQFAIQQGLMDQQTGQFNTEALNQFLMTQIGLNADEARYYADALNQASFQNAALKEQQYQRQLQAASQIGQLGQVYGQQAATDLGLTAQLGEMQRGITSAQLNAYPTQLQIAGNLYSQLYPGLYAGQQVNSKSTSKQSGGLLGGIIGGALQAVPILF